MTQSLPNPCKENATCAVAAANAKDLEAFRRLVGQVMDPDTGRVHSGNIAQKELVQFKDGWFSEREEEYIAHIQELPFRRVKELNAHAKDVGARFFEHLNNPSSEEALSKAI